MAVRHGGDQTCPGWAAAVAPRQVVAVPVSSRKTNRAGPRRAAALERYRAGGFLSSSKAIACQNSAANGTATRQRFAGRWVNTRGAQSPGRKEQPGCGGGAGGSSCTVMLRAMHHRS
jgi:hypothetical protein